MSFRLTNPPPVTEAVRERIAKFLPEALHAAIDSYHQFSSTDVPSDTKSFSAHHTAAKVAIAHIELLIKLAAWAHIKPETADAELASWITLAESELKTLKEDESGDDD
jgi:hypothetical protein